MTNIDFADGVVKISTKGQAGIDTPYFKFYFGTVTGSVAPYNYDAENDIFKGLTIKINGDIYDIPNYSDLTIGGSGQSNAYDTISYLVSNLSYYTYTNPKY